MAVEEDRRIIQRDEPGDAPLGEPWKPKEFHNRNSIIAECAFGYTVQFFLGFFGERVTKILECDAPSARNEMVGGCSYRAPQPLCRSQWQGQHQRPDEEECSV